MFVGKVSMVRYGRSEGMTGIDRERRRRVSAEWEIDKKRLRRYKDEEEKKSGEDRERGTLLCVCHATKRNNARRNVNARTPPSWRSMEGMKRGEPRGRRSRTEEGEGTESESKERGALYHPIKRGV